MGSGCACPDGEMPGLGGLELLELEAEEEEEEALERLELLRVPPPMGTFRRAPPLVQ
ncbi:hypothetical protein MUK42_27643 [Musa troglodytarum]|uniref:Uncharacterized protein n=1 Tax=Musa troglodytarum TaxID=320322 RepID=A0A9E7F885_9LILI|nr:hypothetical protein MUK42_27643 [Musa troglodytarum]